LIIFNYSSDVKKGLFLSSFLQKSGKNVPLLRTAQAAKNKKCIFILQRILSVVKKFILPTGLALKQ
jgi:hypothetical protein